MPKKADELGALTVSRIQKPGLHFVGGVAGLGLQVLPTGGRTWVMRAVMGGKRREMGLGGYPDVTLAQAKEAARYARKKIADGTDPIREKKSAQSALRASQAKMLTFRESAETFIKAHEASWKNKKHRNQWVSTLSTYTYPKIGSLFVRDVELSHVLAILEPIWLTKTITAKRLRGRIEEVLDWASVRGYRDGDNPARWRGHLDKILAAPAKIAPVAHHKAMPVNEIGDFMPKLRGLTGIGARALEFLILTAARSGEVRGATWEEIDMHNRCWTVPANRMKAGKEHKVALSHEAIGLLESLKVDKKVGIIFPAPGGGQLSDMTLTAVLRRQKLDVVPHGFRSTFRNWAAQETNYPREVAELSIAHSIGTAVERAYFRGDLLEKRRGMMSDWAGFCAISQKGKMIGSAQ